jgi:hypothetical protein
MNKHTIEELNKIAPRITEHFGMPFPLEFNYLHKRNVWNILEDKLVIDCEDDTLMLNIWLEADYSYTGSWTIAKCQLNGNVERFIQLVEAVRDTFIKIGDIFPCTVE